jgi:hypothetical protein
MLHRWRQLIARLDGPGIRDAAEARTLLAVCSSSGRWGQSLALFGRPQRQFAAGPIQGETPG